MNPTDPRPLEREALIDSILKDLERAWCEPIGRRASTTDILRDVLRRRLPAAVEPAPMGTREPLIEVLDWMCDRPGASWIATIQDVVKAAEALSMEVPFKWDERTRRFVRSPSAAGGVTGASETILYDCANCAMVGEAPACPRCGELVTIGPESQLRAAAAEQPRTVLDAMLAGTTWGVPDEERAAPEGSPIASEECIQIGNATTPEELLLNHFFCGDVESPDCSCRGTDKQQECAEQGCGYCKAASL